MAASPPTSTQLEFTQAMSDFKVMFPSIEADVIETVLRANNGAVDATIDHLLAMTADNELETSLHEDEDRPPNYPQSHGHPPSYLQATQDGSDDLINLGQATAQLDLDPRPASPKFHLLSEPPVPASSSPSWSPGRAYSDPKRAEAEAAEAAGSTDWMPTQRMVQAQMEANLARGDPTRDSEALAQYLKDERMALMMQNEEFMAELREDREFMSALDQDLSEHSWPEAAQGHPPLRTKGVDPEAVFRDKLKNMGKSSKKKFTQLAGMFSRRKGHRPFLGAGGGAPSKDNLLLSSDSLTLAEDDSEEDEDQPTQAKKSQPSKGKYTSF